MKRLPGAAIWVALFWIITLFASFNAIAKSFTTESRGRMLYLYTLVSPEVFIGAKAIYQSVILLVLSIVAMLVYKVLFAMVIEDYFVFATSLIFGSTGIAIILSLLSTISSKAGKNFTLLAILGLPILLPLLMVTTTLMKNAIDGIALSVQWKYIFVLLGLNGVSLALALVLFPYLWRE